MSDGSHIQWTEATWNFVSGCTKISEGCLNCYIERTPPFRMAHRRFDKAAIGGGTGVTLHEDRLTLPLTWRKPRRIFVNSLADLFHEDVPEPVIARAFAVMVAAPHHTFQVLTKRHGRMRSVLRSDRFWLAVSDELGKHWNTERPDRLRMVPPWIWLGVSVEDQSAARLRIPALLDVPAAIRWLSCEPLIGPVDIAPWADRGLSWAVVGGESGPAAKATALDARPAPGVRAMDLDWARLLVKQCEQAGVPVFVKQLGEVWARENGADRKGGDPAHWPLDLCVREYPQTAVPA